MRVVFLEVSRTYCPGGSELRSLERLVLGTFVAVVSVTTVAVLVRLWMLPGTRPTTERIEARVAPENPDLASGGEVPVESLGSPPWSNDPGGVASVLATDRDFPTSTSVVPMGVPPTPGESLESVQVAAPTPTSTPLAAG
ncbi:MAG: hypothetical protein Q8O76_06935, partial [Chloroflexota bacterium]|nr:hypothetical protein [Chloroflexota bacterium]